MKDNELNNLARLVKKTGKYKPGEKPIQPDNPPCKEELEKKYKLDLRTMKVDKEKKK